MPSLSSLRSFAVGSFVVGLVSLSALSGCAAETETADEGVAGETEEAITGP